MAQPGQFIGRTATHVPWGNDWITGLIWDITIREGRKPRTLEALMRWMTAHEFRELHSAAKRLERQ